MLQQRYPSILGFIALSIWSFSALFATLIVNIPVFEMLAIVYSLSAIAILGKVAWQNEWYKLKQPAVVWFIGIVGIFGNDIFYFEAFKHAPATQIDLINYLWPIFTVLFASLIARENVRLNHIVGCLVSFSGVFYLIHADGLGGFNIQYWYGYLLALMDALVWALYVLVCRRYKRLNSEAIGGYCAVAALFSILIHNKYELFVMPNYFEISSMILVGIFLHGLAYIMWEKGIKKGNFALLSTGSYFTPISSILLLIIFGKAQYSNVLMTSAGLVSAGALVANRHA